MSVPKDWKDEPDETTPVSAAALKDLEERVTSEAALPDSVVLDSTSINLTRPPYSVKPEEDITEKLQAAIDALATTDSGGWIYLPTSAEYELSDTLTIPPRKFSEPQLFVGIAGSFHSLGGSPGIATPGGLLLVTSATEGSILALSPASDGEAKLGRPASNVMVGLRNVTFKAPVDPQITGLDLAVAVRARLEGVTVGGGSSAGSTFTGSGFALTLPTVSNLRGSYLDGVDLNGFPNLLLLTEHAFASRLTLANAKVGMVTEGMPNLSVLPDVMAVDVGTVLKAGGAGLGAGGKLTMGLAVEWDSETGDTAPKALIQDPSSVIRAFLHLSASKINAVSAETSLGGYPSIGGRGIYIDSVDLGGGDWRGKHPRDTFKRRWTDNEGGAAPGLCSDTLHPWRVTEGAFKITQEASEGKLQSTLSEGTSEALLPVRGRGATRIIRSTFYPGAGKFSVIWRLNKRQGGTAESIEVWLRNTGSAFAEIKAAGVQLVKKAGEEVPILKGGGPYAVAIKVEHNVLGLPSKVTVYVAGVELMSGTLGETERNKLTPGTSERIPLEDGIRFLSDTESYLTLYEVVDA